MTHKTNLVASALASVLLLGGCGILKKKQPEPSPSAAVVAPPSTALTAPPSTPTAAPEAAVTDDAIPTPQDFEDDAFAKVTDKTYKQQILDLKQEIEAK